MLIRLALPIVALLGALIAAPIAPQDAPQQEVVRLVDGGQFVELALDDVRVADFVAGAQALLGVPIQALPEEVVPAELHQKGNQRVPVAAFRDAFDAVLRREGFWTWDDSNGGEPVIVVRRAPRGKFLDQIPFTASVISLDELASGPSRRAPLYTTTFPLEHMSARDSLVVLMGILDSASETVRHNDPGNQLSVTASREHLLAIRDVLAQLDVPGPEAPGLALKVSALERRLADLEKRLTTLETTKAGG